MYICLRVVTVSCRRFLMEGGLRCLIHECNTTQNLHVSIKLFYAVICSHFLKSILYAKYFSEYYVLPGLKII